MEQAHAPAGLVFDTIRRLDEAVDVPSSGCCAGLHLEPATLARVVQLKLTENARVEHSLNPRLL